MQVAVYFEQALLETFDFDHEVLIEDVVKLVQSKLPYRILCARVNEHRQPLNTVLKKDCKVELLDLRDPWANMVYQSSLSLLYMKACKDVVGECDVLFHNSLSKGIYTTIQCGTMASDLDVLIQRRMEELVHDAVLIEQEKLDRDALLDLAKETKNRALYSMVEHTPDLKVAFVSKIEDVQEIFYMYMVPNASYLEYFEVKRYKNGMLLRFPHPSDPSVVPMYCEQKLLYNAFSEATRFDRITGMNYASKLNETVLKQDSLRLVLLSEALHEKKIAEIAERINQEHKRIILIAGPSSSGKTTFAKRLCTQLSVLGLKPLYLGTDDYFKDRLDTPLGKDGKPDFESLHAVDVDLFETQMKALLAGKKVDLPVFDFVEGKKVFGKRVTSIRNNQPIVIEGLHCLNPELTKNIEESDKFGIYISPLTQLNIDPRNRIPTTDARMLRRIVRDANFRGCDASVTIRRWKKVREGEEVNIFPYCENADVFFNSHCVYELAVLKKYAEPLLLAITPEQEEYVEARRMLHFLQFFVSMSDDSVIPNNSIMREFIGGSVFAKWFD